MRSAALTTLALALGLTACGDGGEATQVMVILEASDALEASAARLIVRVRSGDGEVVFRDDLEVGTEVSLPANVPVVPRDDDASRTFTLDAILLDAESNTSSRVSTTEAFEEGTYREVVVPFPDAPVYETSPGDSAYVDMVTASGVGVTDIEGATLTLTPEEGAHVLLFVSAQLDGPGGATGSYAELLVDGAVWARGDSATYQGQSVQFVNVLEGDGEAHQVGLRFGSDADRDHSISDVRLYAVPVPPFADLHFAKGPFENVVGTDWTRVTELALEPVYPGDYVVFFGTSMSESPGGSGVNVRFDGSSGNYPRNDEFTFGREPSLPLFAARVDRIDVAATVYAIEARAPFTMASVLAPVVVALRADAFPAVLSNLDTTPIVVGAGGSEPLPSVTLDAQTEGTHWLTLTDNVVRASNADMNGVMGITYDRDGTEVGERVRGSIGGDTTTMAHIDLFEAAAPVTLGATMSPRDGTMECRTIESSIVAIRL